VYLAYKCHLITKLMLKSAQRTIRTINIYQLPMQVNIREAMIFHCNHHYAVTLSVYAERYFSTEKWSLRYSVTISLLTCLLCAANRMARKSASVYVCLHTNMAAAVPFITMRELVLATQTEEDCRQWLRGRGLLAQQMTCPRCHTLMEERLYSRVSDGVIWRCPPKNCRATVSLRKGSFFECSHLPLTKLTDLIYYWSMELSNDQVERQVKQHFAGQLSLSCVRNILMKVCPGLWIAICVSNALRIWMML